MTMKTPRPWRSSPPEDGPPAHIRQLLNDAAEVSELPAAERARIHRRIEQTVSSGWSVAFLWRAAVVLTAAGAGLATVLVVGPTLGPSADIRWRTISLGDVGTLDVSTEAVVRMEHDLDDADEQRAYLLAGEARASIAKRDPERPFVVVTPHVRVVVTGTRFGVAVSSDSTAIVVEEGTVRVESMTGGTMTLRTGDRVDSSDQRFVAVPAAADPQEAEPPPAFEDLSETDRPRASSDCSRLQSVTKRRRCLSRLAAGSDLAAQNALYELGLLEKNEQGDPAAALGAWQRYEGRYPDGMLAPEVSIAILRELLDARRYPEALAQTERFRSSFPNDPRAPDLALIRAKLACTQFGGLSDALAAFDEALVSERRALRQEALFGKGACLQRLSGPAAALDTWRQYLREFPTGRHASEIRQRLNE